MSLPTGLRRSWGELTLDQQTRALNLVYQNYNMPFQVGPEWVAEHTFAHHIDPKLSPVYYDSRGELLGLALVAVRQSRAWVGGFGINPVYRGNRLSGALLQSALESLVEVRHIQLEVLVGNLRAVATYHRAGFEIHRQLAVLEGSAGPPAWPIQPSGPPCWQREPDSLKRLEGLQGRGSGLLYRDNQIFQVEQGARWGDLGLSGRLRISNEPVGSPLFQQVVGLGWREVARQHEMHLSR